MTSPESDGDRVFHLADGEAWARAFATGEYRESTLGMSLDEVGFIHLSYVHQLRGTADRFYQGKEGIVLLVIDPERVGAEIRDEPAAGSGELFPHLYGPLPVAAVVAAPAVGLTPDGRLDLDAILAP